MGRTVGDTYRVRCPLGGVGTGILLFLYGIALLPLSISAIHEVSIETTVPLVLYALITVGGTVLLLLQAVQHLFGSEAVDLRDDGMTYTRQILGFETDRTEIPLHDILEIGLLVQAEAGQRTFVLNSGRPLELGRRLPREAHESLISGLKRHLRRFETPKRNHRVYPVVEMDGAISYAVAI